MCLLSDLPIDHEKICCLYFRFPFLSYLVVPGVARTRSLVDGSDDSFRYSM